MSFHFADVFLYGAEVLGLMCSHLLIFAFVAFALMANPKKKKNAKADVKEPMAYVFLLGERRTYGNFFYHKLINHIYVDLFLGSLFCFIDLWSVFMPVPYHFDYILHHTIDKIFSIL